MEFAEEAGAEQAAALTEMVRQQSEVDWRQLLKHMGKHTLVLRFSPHFFLHTHCVF